MSSRLRSLLHSKCFVSLSLLLIILSRCQVLYASRGPASLSGYTSELSSSWYDDSDFTSSTEEVETIVLPTIRDFRGRADRLRRLKGWMHGAGVFDKEAGRRGSDYMDEDASMGDATFMEEDTLEFDEDIINALAARLGEKLKITSDNSESFDQNEQMDKPRLNSPETKPIDKENADKQELSGTPWEKNEGFTITPDRVDGNVLVLPANFPRHYLEVIKKIKRVNVQMNSESPDTATIRRLVTGISHYFDTHKDARHPHNCTCTKHLREDFKHLLEPHGPVKQVSPVSAPTPPRTSHTALIPDSRPPPVSELETKTSRPHIILPSTSPTPIIRQDEPPPSPKSLGLLYYMPFLGHLSAVAAYFLLGFLIVSTVGMTGLLVNMRLRGIEEKVVRAAAAIRKQSVMRVDV